MLTKMIRLLKPGGMAVVSFNDRYGALLEMTRRAVLWRAATGRAGGYAGQGVFAARRRLLRRRLPRPQRFASICRVVEGRPRQPLHGRQVSLELPGDSAPDQAGGLRVPLFVAAMAPGRSFRLVQAACLGGGAQQGRDGRMAGGDPIFQTGVLPSRAHAPSAAGAEVPRAIARLVDRISVATSAEIWSGGPIAYPGVLGRYLRSSDDARHRRFGEELERLYASMATDGWRGILRTYRSSRLLRERWGVPYQYLCVRAPGPRAPRPSMSKDRGSASTRRLPR